MAIVAAALPYLWSDLVDVALVGPWGQLESDVDAITAWAA
jgi:hypothetical protein